MPFSASLASRNLREQVFAGSPTVFYEENFPNDEINTDNAADDTGAAMAANTVYTGTLTAPFQIPSTGLYWAGICITGTTIPTLLGKTTNVNATAAAALNTLIGGTRANGLAVTSTGAASTAPATMASLTQLAVQPWVLLQ